MTNASLDRVSAMTIANEDAASGATLEVVNPSTGAVFATAPECTEVELDAAMAAAADAQRHWSATDEERCALLRDAAAAVRASSDELAHVLTLEQGKPYQDAIGEVAVVSTWFDYFATLALRGEVLQKDSEATVEVRRRPVGPVAAIGAWNFPLALAAWKIAPAVRAGCSIVLKPSPFTPLATLMLGRLLRAVYPPGIVNVISGGDDLGARMTAHPVPRKISFTGSIATGKAVAAAAAVDLKRVTLELGGNDAAIVLDDVDVDEIAERLFWGAFTNNGQVCAAIKRLYVPRSRQDELVDALAERAARTRVGDGFDPDVELGPINNRPQFERVSDLVGEALATGAAAITGGTAIPGDGFFFAPTVLTGVSEGMRVVDEEQFGPVLPVLVYDDVDEAIERANSTMYGLSGSVWSKDVERATTLAKRLECGTAWVNTHLAVTPQQPAGGCKWSGIGVENGQDGLHELTELQVVHRRT